MFAFVPSGGQKITYGSFDISRLMTLFPLEVETCDRLRFVGIHYLHVYFEFVVPKPKFIEHMGLSSQFVNKSRSTNSRGTKIVIAQDPRHSQR